MSMNETPSANRVHIAFFGRRNAGKSSLVNAVTGQNLAVVSEIKGTTTDPVYKAMELLPLGPVVIIDTPGIDDEGELGEKRVGKARQVLNKTDIAVLVLDGELPGGLLPAEKELLDVFMSRGIPHITVLNKSDAASAAPEDAPKDGVFPVSAKTGENINLLKEKIAELALNKEPEQRLAADLIKPNDFVILVIPIDKAAPKGRLILPQQQVIRDILEAGANAVSVRECELERTLADIGKKPSLVITDSQAFALVSAIVPKEIPLTSFSILFARCKGFLKTSVKGAAALDSLQDGDKILVCEGCTHHRQCDDIGTVKLPRMIKNHSKKELEFRFCSGGDFPQDLSPYKAVIHCGACMLNEREMRYRRAHSEEQNVPFTNYGIAIAHIHGILERSIAMLSIEDA
jgi:[FeFe] hydrogenase H-cluster maturation GTPase HydF